MFDEVLLATLHYLIKLPGSVIFPQLDLYRDVMKMSRQVEGPYDNYILGHDREYLM